MAAETKPLAELLGFLIHNGGGLMHFFASGGGVARRGLLEAAYIQQAQVGKGGRRIVHIPGQG